MCPHVQPSQVGSFQKCSGKLKFCLHFPNAFHELFTRWIRDTTWKVCRNTYKSLQRLRLSEMLQAPPSLKARQRSVSLRSSTAVRTGTLSYVVLSEIQEVLQSRCNSSNFCITAVQQSSQFCTGGRRSFFFLNRHNKQVIVEGVCHNNVPAPVANQNGPTATRFLR